MNEITKRRIIELRNEGMGYMKIAKLLGLHLSTVKSFCQRHKVTKDTSADELLKKHCCLQCGKPVVQHKGKKERKFCGDKCRMNWWNSHRDLVRHFHAHEEECQYCHKHFIVPGKEPRKYCCHACYIADRFGLDNNGKKSDISRQQI